MQYGSFSASGTGREPWTRFRSVTASTPMSERNDQRSRPCEFAGKRSYLYDLFGSETRRFTRERARVGTEGLTIGARYVGDRGSWLFAHSFAARGWEAVDVFVNDTFTWQFLAGASPRPIFLHVPSGSHEVIVARTNTAHVLRTDDELARLVVELKPRTIVEVSVRPERSGFSPHLRRGVLTARSEPIRTSHPLQTAA